MTTTTSNYCKNSFMMSSTAIVTPVSSNSGPASRTSSKVEVKDKTGRAREVVLCVQVRPSITSAGGPGIGGAALAQARAAAPGKVPAPAREKKHSKASAFSDFEESELTSSSAMVRARGILDRIPFDLIVLVVILLVVWGLLLLPIIYFHTEIVNNCSIEIATLLAGGGGVN